MRSLELIPVVELEPFAFSDRRWTTSSSGDHSAAPVLRRLLLHHHLEHLEHETALNGGSALFDCGALRVAPQGCGDLGDLADWGRAGEHAGERWSMMWIGHK